jgi:hypothetical protein
MAYGNGNSSDTHESRAIPLAVGNLTAFKKAELATLRSACIKLRTDMVKAVFVAEPLRGCDRVKIDKHLQKVQSQSELNSIYAQCCRISVLSAINEQNSRYLKNLVGRLKNVSDRIPQADSERKYFYVPVTIQDAITQDELAGLEKLGAQKFSKVIALFASVVLNKRNGKLTSNQADTIREIHRQVQAKHEIPDFIKPDSIVSLPLHYQCLPTADRNISTRLNTSINALLLEDSSNAVYQFFLNIANPIPRQERISLPICIRKDMVERLATPGPRKGYVSGSLMLELGPDNVGVRLVLSKKKPVPMSLKKTTHILTRDFGYRNTVTLALIEREEAIDLAKLEEIQAFTKDEARRYLSEHVVETMPKIVGIARFSGLAFLKRIYDQTLKIDKIKSAIDKEYVVLERERLTLVKAFNLQEGDLITKTTAPKGTAHYRTAWSFFIRLGRIREMKAVRRGIYRKIAALKKCWFGFLANLEVGLAKTAGAVVIRENLTNLTEEKDSPTYKGRTFNRMINAGARGQYAKRASGKFKWNGIPEIALPSYYTSSTCFLHGIVDKTQRKGDVFACKRCLAEGRSREHADEHAALMLAVYPFLQLKSTLCDTQEAA